MPIVGRRAIVVVALVAFCDTHPAAAQLVARRITTGPTGFTAPIFGVSAPGEPTTLYVVQQGGQIRAIDTTSPAATPRPFLSLGNAEFPNSNLTSGGEQGLLGLAFHPGYAANGLFYAFYTANSGGELRVDQFRASGGVVLTGTANRRTVISIPHPTNTNHNGGWIGFAPGAGTVLSVATGDGGGGNDPANNAQNTNSLLGKMLRIDVGPNGLDFAAPAATYAIPTGNMTVNPNGNLASPAPPSLVVRPEIYAYGLRNPWRNSYDRVTGDLYIADVGQGAREEINVIPAGRLNSATLNQAPGSTNGINFGWRLREGTIATPTVGSSQLRHDDVVPVFDYVRTGTSGQLPFYGRSVTGGYVYRGPALHDFGVDLGGTYLFADYVSNQIGSFRYDVGARSLTDLRNRTTEIMGSLPAGVSLSAVAAFAEDGLGNVYLINAATGDVFRIGAAQPDGPRIDVAVGQSRTQTEVGYPVMSGGFALRKTGAGRLVLTAANAFTGATSVEAGTLALSSAAALGASAAVEVTAAATLDVASVAGGYDVPAGQIIGGSGTVAGSVTFGAGATLSPGAGGSGALGLASADRLPVALVPEPSGLGPVAAALLAGAAGFTWRRAATRPRRRRGRPARRRPWPVRAARGRQPRSAVRRSPRAGTAGRP